MAEQIDFNMEILKSIFSSPNIDPALKHIEVNFCK